MSIMMNIATPTNQSTNNAIGINVGNASTNNSINQSKTVSNEFASLIASLLGLNSPNQSQQTMGSTEAKANTTQENIIASLGVTTGLNTEQLTKLKSSIDPQDKNALSALSDLFKSLEQIISSLENGTKIDPKLIDNAIASINVLASSFDAIIPTTIGKNIASATGIYQAVSSNTQSGLASLAMQGIDTVNSQQNALLQTLNNSSQVAQGQANNGAQTQNTNITLANEIVTSLSQMAKGLAQSTPELAQKISSFIEKITSAINNISTNSGQANPSIASASQAGALQAGLANLTKLENNKAGQDLKPVMLNLSAQSDGVKTNSVASLSEFISSQNANSNNNNNQNINVKNQFQTGNNNSNGQNAAISLASTQSTKANILTQADPILTVQSNGQAALITGSAASIKPSTALYQQPMQNLNLPHIAVEFARNVQNGATRFQIQLNPPEMGRIDIKLDLDNSGTINARLTVERAETFDLLQRDARALERALAQAGLDSSKTNLEFTLKDNPFAKNDNHFCNDDKKFANEQTDDVARIENDSDILNKMPNAIIHRVTATLGGLNMIA